jgi:redox-sensitive bicupin YhaK (pirin superfamily)
MTIRPILHSRQAVPTREGAGVRLFRAFGNPQDAVLFDPFLLLDFFSSDDPADFRAGFPWHPHRGIETITYLHRGRVAHADSLGNSGVIGPGDVQWMTAGSGIIHQEMPDANAARIRGFQLWANLPRRDKMMDPRYRDITAPMIPLAMADGARVSVVAGEYRDTRGPVDDIVIEPSYFDVTLAEDCRFSHQTVPEETVLAFVYEGEVAFAGTADRHGTGTCLLFGPGETITATAGTNGAGFLLVAGRPLGEPIAWYGPIVMNTADELERAFEEYETGSFIKVGRKRHETS